jgi:hypothetical protein
VLLAIVAADRLCTAEPTLSVASPAVTVRWVYLYVAFTGLSLTWSATASLPASAAYWCGTAADVFTTVLLFRAGCTRRIAEAIMKGFVAGSCVIAAAAWIMPAEYDLRLGDQDYLNANTVANLSAFGFFFAHYLTRVTRTRWSAVSAVLALTVLRSLSKATMFAFAASAAVLFISDRSMRRRTKLLVLSAVLAAVLWLWGLFDAYYDLYTTTGNQAETLTGRTAIWAYVADAIPERLLFGHGFDSMWKVVPAFGTFQARHAENEVLEQIYAFGLVGLAFAIAVYTSLFRQVRSITTTSVRLTVTSLLVYVLVRGLAEAEPFDLLLPLWAIVLFSQAIHTQPSGSTAEEIAVDGIHPPFQSAVGHPAGGT